MITHQSHTSKLLIITRCGHHNLYIYLARFMCLLLGKSCDQQAAILNTCNGVLGEHPMSCHVSVANCSQIPVECL